LDRGRPRSASKVTVVFASQSRHLIKDIHRECRKTNQSPTRSMVAANHSLLGDRALLTRTQPQRI